MDEDTFDTEASAEYNYSDSLELIKQGAEAKLYRGVYLGRRVIVKERFSKKYRHPTLDVQLTKERLKSEVRCICRCRQHGIEVPMLYLVEPLKSWIVMEYIEDSITVRDHIVETYNRLGQNVDEFRKAVEALAKEIGRIVGVMHKQNIIHGDLTTSNMLLRKDLRVVMIDFGLSYNQNLPEDKGVDLYVLEKALLSTHPNSEGIFEDVIAAYWKSYGKGHEAIRKKLDEVRLRGRKRLMVG